MSNPLPVGVSGDRAGLSACGCVLVWWACRTITNYAGLGASWMMLGAEGVDKRQHHFFDIHDLCWKYNGPGDWTLRCSWVHRFRCCASVRVTLFSYVLIFPYLTRLSALPWSRVEKATFPLDWSATAVPPHGKRRGTVALFYTNPGNVINWDYIRKQLSSSRNGAPTNQLTEHIRRQVWQFLCSCFFLIKSLV